jgi:hypothetical protein
MIVEKNPACPTFKLWQSRSRNADKMAQVLNSSAEFKCWIQLPGSNARCKGTRRQGGWFDDVET